MNLVNKTIYQFLLVIYFVIEALLAIHVASSFAITFTLQLDQISPFVNVLLLQNFLTDMYNNNLKAKFHAVYSYYFNI